MSEEQDKILTMLENATINSEQANELLEAVESSNGRRKMAVTAVAELPEDLPDMDRFRSYWAAPFAVLAGATGLLALWLRALAARRKPGAFFVAWLFVLSLGLTVLMYLSRKSTWVHIRVQEKDGRKIAISLPVPLNLASQAVELARKQAEGEDLENLEMAAAAIAAAQQSFSDPDADPIMIAVDDENAQVQVFFG